MNDWLVPPAVMAEFEAEKRRTVEHMARVSASLAAMEPNPDGTYTFRYHKPRPTVDEEGVVMSLVMKIAVPVPLDALSAQDKKPYLREARKVGLKRALEGLAQGYRRTSKEVRHTFVTREEYEANFEESKAPPLIDTVEAVVIFELDVEQR